MFALLETPDPVTIYNTKYRTLGLSPTDSREGLAEVVTASTGDIIVVVAYFGPSCAIQ